MCMNVDPRSHRNHAESLADYVRYYCAPDSLVNNACLERITCSEMKISWYGVDGKQRVSKVGFDPQMKDGSEARTRLVALAQTTSVSRVPRPARPATSIALFIVICLSLLGMFAYAPDAVPSWYNLCSDFPMYYFCDLPKRSKLLQFSA